MITYFGFFSGLYSALVVILLSTFSVGGNTSINAGAYY